MKNFILAALMLLAGLAHGAASDVAVEQRNLTNNGWVTRLMVSPPTNGLLIYNTSTLLPNWVTTAGGLTLTGSTLTGVEQANWNSVSGTSQILNKPTLAAVATSGAYADLTGKPTIPAAQVQSDWNAVSAPAAILNKPSLFSGAYADLTGIPSTFAPTAHTHAAADIVSGTLAVARIPSLPIGQTTGLQTELDSKFATPTGTTAQYLRGDGSVATFPSIPAAQVNSDWNSVSGISQILNKPTLAAVATSGAYADLSGRPSLATVATTGAYADLTGKPTIPAAQVNADWNAVSGVSQILNKPTLNSGTVTSITAGTGLSGGTITTSGTISLPNTGTAGTYASVTTDAQGRVTSGTVQVVNDSPGRTLVSSTSATGFQVSSTRLAQVCYEGSFSTTSTIGGPSSASVFLETANTNSTTPGDWTTIAQQTYSNNITLAIVLNQVQGNNWTICRYIPAGKFVRIRSGSITGTASVSLNATQQEVLQ